MTTLTAAVDLPPVPRSAPAARHVVRETLAAWGPGRPQERRGGFADDGSRGGLQR